MRILIIEDDRKLCDSLKFQLEKEGILTDLCYDGEDGLDYIRQRTHDLVLLDRMLPSMDGLTVLEKIRAEGISTPVILVTALGELSDKITGLNQGADDYLVKPFAFEELSARIRVMLRKPEKEKSSVCSVADLHVHLDTRRVFRGEKEITLSSREFAVLRYLIQNAGIVLSREKLEQHIWNYDYAGGSNVIDVYIRYLRKKIDEGFEPKLIHTVRGAGYVLREPI